MKSHDEANRRHDLDTLRAFAMLLGVVLHSAMSFTGMPWVVIDSRCHLLFIPMTNGIHSFRMQLFMLISGFFVMRSYRSRGLMVLLRQRMLRIGLPLALSVVTIVPLLEMATLDAQRRAMVDRFASSGPVSRNPLVAAAIRAGDHPALGRALACPSGVESPDAEFHLSPLNWAVLKGDSAAVAAILQAGANVNAQSRENSTAAHLAVLLGQDEILQLLIRYGANAEALDSHWQRPGDLASTAPRLTRAFAGSFGLVGMPDSEMQSRRESCRNLLKSEIDSKPAASQAPTASAIPASVASAGFLSQLRARYGDFLRSDTFATGMQWNGEPLHLFMTPIFHHLWFLWFLCWMIGGFAVAVSVVDRMPAVWRSRLFARPLAWLPAIFCISLFARSFTGSLGPSIGPDTSTGIFPMPHVLFGYSAFFMFGILWHETRKDLPPGSKYWRTGLLLSIFVFLPASMFTLEMPVINTLAQIGTTWCATLGSIGLCRCMPNRPIRALRYLSEASYFVYLLHLPLIIWLQGVIRTWDIPSLPKFVALNLAVLVILLTLFEIGVRGRWLGRLLNGPAAARIRHQGPSLASA